jgi:myo-inositol-1-phosphate synthase
VGLASLARALKPATGLVSELPMFRGADLPTAAEFVLGGHEIRRGSFRDSAAEFRAGSGVFEPELLAAVGEDLERASARVRPGTTRGAGGAIERMADWFAPAPGETTGQIVDRLAADLAAFVQAERIDHLIVLNVSSTEPPFPARPEHQSWPALDAALSSSASPVATVLPASSLYAVAALRAGHTYINFTPSLGASFPAAFQLAESTAALHAGKDGKTGETLMKTVLAPMFAHRNLEVLSWVGHNIFGNRDGQILDEPGNKASKVTTKDQVVHQILGYKPATLVTIEYIPDMGDWKTAWDHIHFRGFLGTPMTLQFTWQGCDSLLAAPLAIDLARLADLEKRRGGRGLMRHLASFFKSPEGVPENDFFRQFSMLEAYAANLRT